MRKKAIPLTTLLAAVFLAASAAAQEDHEHEADWREYVYLQHGIAKEFPGQPITNIDEYRTEVIGEAVRAVLIFRELGDVTVQMTVVKFDKREHLAKAANMMAECIFLAESDGMPLANLPLRAEDGSAAGVRGRVVSVDLNYNLGVRQTACFFTKDRLYKIEGTMVHPVQEDSDMIARFVTTQRFDVETQ
jgi:hypothetical protein